MTHQFSRVPSANIPRSSFDRSFGHKSTFNSGLLIPIFLDEVLPGDTFNVKMNAFARLATPIKPVMDNMYMETFFFFIPNRLVWDNWAKFNGEQDKPGDSTDFLIPYISSPGSGYIDNSLADYMGLPTNVGLTYRHNALFMRAYNLTYDHWFRDQNLQDPPVLATGDGPDNAADYELLSRGKRHDYFTSCLPWPQKSDNPVLLPLGDSAPVSVLGPQQTAGTSTMSIEYGDGTARLDTASTSLASSQTDPADENYKLFANLSEATAATINEIRTAFQIQRLFERDARGGTRLTEIIKSHFGVTSPDARLQRVEFLGSGSSPINISPVAQTTPEDATTPQGNLAGYGTAVLRNHGFTKSFTEHGILLGLVNVRADLTYQRGLHKMWQRETRFDFYWPALSHLGEQEVLNSEIYLDTNATQNAEIFGYQERSAEYRYKPSMITGQFRSISTTPLDVWHLSQDFQTRPVLGDTFITDKPPIDRIVAVKTEPQFLFDSHFSMRCARPMPIYGVPGMIDHF